MANICTKVSEDVKLEYFKKRVGSSKGESISVVALSKKWKLTDEK